MGKTKLNSRSLPVAVLVAAVTAFQVPAGPVCDLAAVRVKLEAEEFRMALSGLEPCVTEREQCRFAGLAYLGLFQPDSAVHFLRKARKAGYMDDTVLIGLAQAMLWTKTEGNAGALLDKVKDKGSAPYFMAMASLHEDNRRFAKALEMYDKAIAIQSPPYIPMFHKAMVLSWMDRLDESIALYTALMDSAGASRGFRTKCKVQRAGVISWKKDLERAERELREVIKQDPANAEGLLALGEVLEWRGRFKEAKNAYRDLLLADPGNQAAKQRLEKLLWVK